MGLRPWAFVAVFPICVFHETRVRARVWPAARREASTAQGRLAHHEDGLIVPLGYAVVDRNARLRCFMRDLQVLEGRGELASVVRVGVLDLPISAEELDRSAGLSFGLVLNWDTSNKRRPNVLEADCIFKPVDAMLFLPFLFVTKWSPVSKAPHFVGFL